MEGGNTIQIELRKDGFYFRFTRTESGYSIVSEWFGPFPTRERMIGAVWGLYHYGRCSLTETFTDEGTRSYTFEEAIYEKFGEPDLNRMVPVRRLYHRRAGFRAEEG